MHTAGFDPTSLSSSFTPPLGQHIAPVDLGCLAELAGFLAGLHQRKKFGAAGASVLALTNALQTQKPIIPSPLIKLQR